MPYLANLDLIRVHGQYVRLDGNPAVGVVSFTPNTILVDTATKEIVKPVAFAAPLNAEGRIIGHDAEDRLPGEDGYVETLGVLLPATNDPDLEPQGWSYAVVEAITDVRRTRSYNLTLHHGWTTFDLSAITPDAPASVGEVNYATVGYVEDRIAGLEADAVGVAARVIPGYWSMPLAGQRGTVAPNPGRLYGLVLRLDRTAIIDRLRIGVTGAQPAWVARLGIYRPRYSEFAASDLIVDAGTVDCSTTGVKELPVSLTLPPGVYYLVSATQEGSGTPPVFTAVDGADPYVATNAATVTSALGVGGNNNSTPGAFSAVTSGVQMYFAQSTAIPLVQARFA